MNNKWHTIYVLFVNTRQSDFVPYSYVMLVKSNVRVLLFRGILEKADKIFQMHSNNAVSKLFIFQELVPA